VIRIGIMCWGVHLHPESFHSQVTRVNNTWMQGALFMEAQGNRMMAEIEKNTPPGDKEVHAA